MTENIKAALASEESIESRLNPEHLSGKKVILEMGMGPFGSLYRADITGLNSNTMFIGVDINAVAVQNLVRLSSPEVIGLQADVMSSSFTEGALLDYSVDLAYAFNLLDAMGRKINDAEYRKFFTKVARMLKPGGVFVIGHWYSPWDVSDLKKFPFESFGLTPSIYEDNECVAALKDTGFSDSLAKRMSANKPIGTFVIVLKKKNGSPLQEPRLSGTLS